MSLIERLRPGVECAPWVIEEVKKLQAERDALSDALSYPSMQALKADAEQYRRLRDSGVELPEPLFGAGRYLSIAGNLDAYTAEQMRDYGDRRAAAERERCAMVCAGLWRVDGQFTADEFAEAIRKGE